MIIVNLEHEALRADLVDWIVDVEDSLSRPLLVGWTARERLILNPEYAWLEHPESLHIRLPASMSEIRNQVSDLTRRGFGRSLPAELSVLLEPLWPTALGNAAIAGLDPVRCTDRKQGSTQSPATLFREVLAWLVRGRRPIRHAGSGHYRFAS